MWPVNLDLNKMSVTTITDTVGAGTEGMEGSLQYSTSGGAMSRSVPVWQSRGTLTQGKDAENTMV